MFWVVVAGLAVWLAATVWLVCRLDRDMPPVEDPYDWQ